MPKQAYNWTGITDDQLKQHIVLEEKHYIQLLKMQQSQAQHKVEHIQAMKDELARREAETMVTADQHTSDEGEG